MTPLASHLTAFFQELLILERRASANTCDSYAYAFKLLLNYASKRLKWPRPAPFRTDRRATGGWLCQ